MKPSSPAALLRSRSFCSSASFSARQPLLRRTLQLAAASHASPILPIAAAKTAQTQWIQCRHSSHSPMSPTAVPGRNKITINTLRSLYKKKTPITMVTAHDFPSALAADLAGVEIVLVGDSLAMVALGLEDTNQLTLDAMIHHCLAVSRGARTAFLIGDLPMGTYETSPSDAIRSALRLIQEGRMNAIKLEGGIELVPTIKHLTSFGIPVLGHIGLTPQRNNSLGGFRVQGKTLESAQKVLQDALALQEAGVFGFVLEAIPEEIAKIITERLDVPTIGIGAGAGCSGQVLVQCDMLGNWPAGRFMPKFVKKYRDVFKESMEGIKEFKDEVRGGQYPAQEHTYPPSPVELEKFKEWIATQPKPGKKE